MQPRCAAGALGSRDGFEPDFHVQDGVAPAENPSFRIVSHQQLARRKPDDLGPRAAPRRRLRTAVAVIRDEDIAASGEPVSSFNYRDLGRKTRRGAAIALKENRGAPCIRPRIRAHNRVAAPVRAPDCRRKDQDDDRKPPRTASPRSRSRAHVGMSRCLGRSSAPSGRAISRDEPVPDLQARARMHRATSLRHNPALRIHLRGQRNRPPVRLLPRQDQAQISFRIHQKIEE